MKQTFNRFSGMRLKHVAQFVGRRLFEKFVEKVVLGTVSAFKEFGSITTGTGNSALFSYRDN